MDRTNEIAGVSGRFRLIPISISRWEALENIPYQQLRNQLTKMFERGLEHHKADLLARRWLLYLKNQLRGKSLRSALKLGPRLTQEAKANLTWMNQSLQVFLNSASSNNVPEEVKKYFQLFSKTTEKLVRETGFIDYESYLMMSFKYAVLASGQVMKNATKEDEIHSKIQKFQMENAIYADGSSFIWPRPQQIKGDIIDESLIGDHIPFGWTYSGLLVPGRRVKFDFEDIKAEEAVEVFLFHDLSHARSIISHFDSLFPDAHLMSVKDPSIDSGLPSKLSDSDVLQRYDFLSQVNTLWQQSCCLDFPTKRRERLKKMIFYAIWENVPLVKHGKSSNWYKDPEGILLFPFVKHWSEIEKKAFLEEAFVFSRFIQRLEVRYSD